MMRWRIFSTIFSTSIFVAVMLWFGMFPVQAGTVYDSPYVTFSPDRQAWTTNARDQNVQWYRENGADDVAVRGAKTLRELQIGEHYYATHRVGSVPVAKWTVQLSQVRCCHNSYPAENQYHGVVFAKETCNKPHFSAWHPVCADCGQVIVPYNFYMSREAAATLDYLEMGSQIYYYYLCPFNNNLEQGVRLAYHNCKAISCNRYEVVYDANTNGDAYTGYMANSYHMYNNATLYDGREVTPQKHLNPNTYKRQGWKFIGWSENPNGVGTFYADGAEIWNLRAGDFHRDGEAGTIRLYAIWKQATATLKIDPNGGTYEEREGFTYVQGSYGDVYRIDSGLVEAPAGYQVTFNTMGGDRIEKIRGTQHFYEWCKKFYFLGELQGELYSFFVPDGNVDYVYATYIHDPVILPEATRKNCSFGGWYYDRELKKYAGGAGAELVPEEDITLYAQWVELLLTSKDNYKDNQGIGAVDLSWYQPDGKDKVYKLYQSRNLQDWQQVYKANAIGIHPTYTQQFDFTGNKEEWVVPYTGDYTIEVYGAQGGDWGEAEGGEGGKVSGRFRLQKGESLAINVGGKNGYNGGGGSRKEGNGGGYSEVSSESKGLLLLAGGGGGAGSYAHGLPGGYQEDRDKEEQNSGDGIVAPGDDGEDTGPEDPHCGWEGRAGGGGGGGYQGGLAGEAKLHYHIPGICYHVHIGSPERLGGCYTKPVICGETLEHVYLGTEYWHWGGLDEEYCPNCGRTDDCPGHERDVFKHVCPIHGQQARNNNEKSPSVCQKPKSYELGCGLSTNIICEYPYDGYPVSSRAAEGGSHYVNTELAYSYTMEIGGNPGNGYVVVRLEDSECLEDPLMRGVYANDLAAPDEVVSEDAELIPVDEKRVKVRWLRSKDNGTTYYHMVESYPTDVPLMEENVMCVSNITSNTLVSGLAGYLCSVDGSYRTKLNRTNGQFTEKMEWTVTLTDQRQFLHVCAIDKAGNISDTTNILVGSIDNKGYPEKYPFVTERLRLEQGENVYLAEDGTYYIRSDGKTPFGLKYGAYMQGPAMRTYQLNYAILESVCANNISVRDKVYVPSDPISDAALELPAEKLQFSAEGKSYFRNAGYVMAVRSNRNSRLDLRQELLLERNANRKEIFLIPIAGILDEGQMVYSDYQMDQENGLHIIGDGEAPVITGLEELARLPLLDRRERNFSLRVTAWDELSGLGELYLEIANLDNGVVNQYYPGADGAVVVNISADEPIFSGEFTVTAHAKDRVGNESTETHGTMEFDLQAVIERMDDSGEVVFKRGESGRLRVRAWGYVDKIEILFPEELAGQISPAECIYYYDLDHSYLQEEEIIFAIPLDFAQDGTYTVTVRAYKKDQVLESRPALAVIGVQGTVLDDLRTRLR